MVSTRRFGRTVRYLSSNPTESGSGVPSGGAQSATTSFSTASPLGKSSSEMHGANNTTTQNKNENNTNSSSEEKNQNDHSNATDEPFEVVILKSAMKFVPELGFTDEAISRG